MKKILLTVIVVLIIGFAGWLVISNSQTQFQKAPDFSLQDFESKTVSLADFSGKPLVINSWAAWCPFCVKELEDFVLAQKEFSGKVVIIAVDRSESLETAKKFTDELGVTDDLIFFAGSSRFFLPIHWRIFNARDDFYKQRRRDNIS